MKTGTLRGARSHGELTWLLYYTFFQSVIEMLIVLWVGDIKGNIHFHSPTNSEKGPMMTNKNCS